MSDPLSRTELMALLLHVESMLYGADQWAHIASIADIVKQKPDYRMRNETRAQHDRLMAELQGFEEHPDACTCGWCVPLGVSRSGTFSACQDAVREQKALRSET